MDIEKKNKFSTYVDSEKNPTLFFSNFESFFFKKTASINIALNFP